MSMGGFDKHDVSHPVDNKLLTDHFFTYRHVYTVQGDNYTCSKPPVDFRTKVPFWPGQGRPKWNFWVEVKGGVLNKCNCHPINGFQRANLEAASIRCHSIQNANVSQFQHVLN